MFSQQFFFSSDYWNSFKTYDFYVDFDKRTHELNDLYDCGVS